MDAYRTICTAPPPEIRSLLASIRDLAWLPEVHKTACPPRLLPPEQLGAGNSLIQGMAQLTLVMGPLLAGALIASIAFGSESAIEDSGGLALAWQTAAARFLWFWPDHDVHDRST